MERADLTDSGGFQVFSLATLRKIAEDGVEFQSHIDGSRRFFTPESVMQIERNLGADVIMQFDHVIPGQSDEVPRDASERSIRWAARCLAEFRKSEPAENRDEDAQALFPIVQGGIHSHLRREAAHALTGMHDWSGFGIGGLSVGEEKPAMYEMLDVVNESLPRDRPRYLMGVGFPDDVVEGIRRGVDLFDCVAPTRMGRNGAAFSPATDASTSSAPSTATIRFRWTRIAIAPPAPASPAPTFGISSSATRFSGSACSPCTMYISFSHWPAPRGAR